MPDSLQITVTHFDRCFSDYVTDWSGLVVGVVGRGQTVLELIDDVCDEVSATTDDTEFPYGDHAYDLLRVALKADIVPSARFWPVDSDGNEINTDTHPDAEVPDEQPAYWFRIRVTRTPMRISLSNDDDGTVTVYCDDQGACDDDQTIDGSSWETPSDMAVGYACITDRPTLVEELEAQGYDVDASEYSAPTDEDMARWTRKCEESC